MKYTLGLISFLAISAASASESHVSIASIKASLFYSNLGRFSENVIDNKDFALWNAVIGEGSAKGPSAQTLITVELKGDKAEGNLLQAPVRIRVKGGKKSILDTKKQAELFENHAYHIAVLVDGTGCEPLVVSAEIEGQPRSRLEKTIPFQCGE